MVAAYVPDYRMAAFKPERASALTDLILFSVVPGKDGHVQDPSGLLSRIPAIAPRGPGRPWRVLLCVGGGGKGRSDGFHAMAQDERARAAFARELASLAREHGLDGIDVDWEHMKDPRDPKALVLLLRDLKRALSPHGLLLTAAAGDPEALLPEAAELLDRIHLMAYDGKQHGTFAQAKNKVRAFLDRGIPARKLCLGIPLYALSNQAEKALSYADVIERYRPAPDVDEVDGYRFSGPETVRKRARYAREHGLGGVMFWELTQDAAEGSLVRVATEALRRDSGPSAR